MRGNPFGIRLIPSILRRNLIILTTPPDETYLRPFLRTPGQHIPMQVVYEVEGVMTQLQLPNSLLNALTIPLDPLRKFVPVTGRL